jgi:hypothetical protein
VGARRAFPARRTHQHFTVLPATFAMELVNRHGPSVTAPAPALKWSPATPRCAHMSPARGDTEAVAAIGGDADVAAAARSPIHLLTSAPTIRLHFQAPRAPTSGTAHSPNQCTCRVGDRRSVSWLLPEFWAEDVDPCVGPAKSFARKKLARCTPSLFSRTWPWS